MFPQGVSNDIEKQFQALQASNQARHNQNHRPLASAPLGSTLGGINSAGMDGISVQPNITGTVQSPATMMSQPGTQQQQPNPQLLAHRRRQFMSNLANIHIARNAPLPPTFTGVPYPSNYDPANSVWNMLDYSDKEVGFVRIAGKDVDVLKLWTFVYKQGGYQKVAAANGWKAFLAPLDLPEEIPPNFRTGAQTRTDVVLGQVYTQILGLYEEGFTRNLQEQQRRAMANRQAQSMNTPSNITGLASSSQTPAVDPSAGSIQRQPSLTQTLNSELTTEPLVADATTEQPTEQSLLDQDSQGIKRKLDEDNSDGKRVRQRTEPATLEPLAEPPVSRLRRKVEYVPYSREVDTYGGRDLKFIEGEIHQTQRRPMRELNDWGTVDIETLTLSVRSRLSIELSYALTTLTLMSTMRGPTEGSGFPVHNCGDLLHELIDLIEDEAFSGHPDAGNDPEPVTHRQLIDALREVESQPFASLKLQQGSKNPDNGPRQRPGQIILAVLNIIRNLVFFTDNIDFLSRHERLLDVILRLCGAVSQPTPHAESSALSLADLATVRKDVLYIFVTLSVSVDLKTLFSQSSTKTRAVRRIFELVTSYITHPAEAVTPMTYTISTGTPPTGPFRVPGLADIALNVFNSISQKDAHREIFAKIIPTELLWHFFESLIHRLPVTDSDFNICIRDNWPIYIERLIMAVYSVAFLAPPEIKQKFKNDRALGFDKVMLRLVQKFLALNPREHPRDLVVRRAIEALKVVDDCEDSFDTSQSTVPPLSFGMGYGEISETKQQTGPGILGGYRAYAWDLMMLIRDPDELVFGELESMARIEY